MGFAFRTTTKWMLEGVPVIPRGKGLEGQFFPLLFGPQDRKWARAARIEMYAETTSWGAK